MPYCFCSAPCANKDDMKSSWVGNGFDFGTSAAHQTWCCIHLIELYLPPYTVLLLFSRLIHSLCEAFITSDTLSERRLIAHINKTHANIFHVHVIHEANRIWQKAYSQCSSPRWSLNHAQITVNRFYRVFHTWNFFLVLLKRKIVEKV